MLFSTCYEMYIVCGSFFNKCCDFFLIFFFNYTKSSLLKSTKSSCLKSSLILPKFNGYTSTRVYFMFKVAVLLSCKTLNGVSVTVFFLIQEFLILQSTTVCKQNINKHILNLQTKNLRKTAFSVGITIPNQKSFTKTISKSSLNFHVYWDTLYLKYFCIQFFMSE